MYERIASNVRKTWLLIFIFSLLTMAIGAVVGYYLGVGFWGLAIAVVVAILMTWGSYFNSDKIALSVSRAKPADESAYPQFHNIIDGLCIAAGLPKPRLFVVQDEAPNAFATGRNPEHAAIAVTTGLLQKLNRDELEGVLAHELAHVKNRDTLVMTIAVTLVGVIVLLADVMIRAMWWGGGRRDNDSGGGLGAIFAVLGIVLLIVAPLIAQLLQFAVSRQREFLADADGVFLTRYPDGLISALEKLQADQTVVHSASRATSHLWIESPMATEQVKHQGMKNATKSGARLNRMFETHPPLEMRIEALRKSALSGNFPAGDARVPPPPAAGV
jgi:heat shock protein HtpX